MVIVILIITANVNQGSPVTECPTCAWPVSESYEVISRHVTSDGIVTYSRCVCGEVRIRLQPYGEAQTLQPRP
jgi:hypothetical protein